jgi:hypothetical protein
MPESVKVELRVLDEDRVNHLVRWAKGYLDGPQREQLVALVSGREGTDFFWVEDGSLAVWKDGELEKAPLKP